MSLADARISILQKFAIFTNTMLKKTNDKKYVKAHCKLIKDNLFLL